MKIIIYQVLEISA